MVSRWCLLYTGGCRSSWLLQVTIIIQVAAIYRWLLLQLTAAGDYYYTGGCYIQVAAAPVDCCRWLLLYRWLLYTGGCCSSWLLQVCRSSWLLQVTIIIQVAAIYRWLLFQAAAIYCGFYYIWVIYRGPIAMSSCCCVEATAVGIYIGWPL
jgi:hypothetical protein